MIFFVWDDSFNTGFGPIDNQHKEYIQVIDNLQKSITSQNQALFEKYSAEFIKHLEEHFSTENGLMTKHKYQGYFSHKAEHDRFLDKIKRNLPGLNNQSSIEIDLFFEIAYRWLKNHLDINDRKLTRFLIDNNLN